MSLALPDRRDLSVDLYPSVTTKGTCQYLGISRCEKVYGPLPDFMTNARRLLILSAVFFAFLVVGAIFANAPARDQVVEPAVEMLDGGLLLLMACVVELSDKR